MDRNSRTSDILTNVFGPNTTGTNSFAELVRTLLDFISLLIPLIFAATFLVIAWRLIDAWILHGGDSEKVKEGKSTALIGIIALVIMSAIWGIVAVLRSSLLGS